MPKIYPNDAALIVHCVHVFGMVLVTHGTFTIIRKKWMSDQYAFAMFIIGCFLLQFIIEQTQAYLVLITEPWPDPFFDQGLTNKDSFWKETEFDKCEYFQDNPDEYFKDNPDEYINDDWVKHDYFDNTVKQHEYKKVPTVNQHRSRK